MSKFEYKIGAHCLKRSKASEAESELSHRLRSWKSEQFLHSMEEAENDTFRALTQDNTPIKGGNSMHKSSSGSSFATSLSNLSLSRTTSSSQKYKGIPLLSLPSLKNDRSKSLARDQTKLAIDRLSRGEGSKSPQASSARMASPHLSSSRFGSPQLSSRTTSIMNLTTLETEEDIPRTSSQLSSKEIFAKFQCEVYKLSSKLLIFGRKFHSEEFVLRKNSDSTFGNKCQRLVDLMQNCHDLFVNEGWPQESQTFIALASCKDPLDAHCVNQYLKNYHKVINMNSLLLSQDDPVCMKVTMLLVRIRQLLSKVLDALKMVAQIKALQVVSTVRIQRQTQFFNSVCDQNLRIAQINVHEMTKSVRKLKGLRKPSESPKGTSPRVNQHSKSAYAAKLPKLRRL